jgi:hypothetical protein
MELLNDSHIAVNRSSFAMASGIYRAPLYLWTGILVFDGKPKAVYSA